MATVEWVANALGTYHVGTITISGSWSTGNTITMTINGKAIVLTVGAVTTTTGIASAVAAAWNGDAALGTETRTQTGNNIPEFNEAVATVSGSVVTITGRTLGRRFTLSVSDTASGAATFATVTTASGPNDVSNTANWSTGSLPSTGDTIVVRTPISMLTGLDALASVTPAVMQVYSSFWAGGATIGLPLLSGSGTTQYVEYRNRFLQISGCTLYEHGVGDSNRGNTIANIDFGTGTVSVVAYATGQSNDTTRPALCLKMNPASATNANLQAFSGSIGVGFFGETCKCTPKIISSSGNDGDLSVVFGANTTIGATYTQAGGTAEIYSGTTTFTLESGTLTLNGSGNHPIVKHNGGTINQNSTGTYGGTSINMGPKAVVYFDKTLSTKANGTTINCAAGSEIFNRYGNVSSFAYKCLNGKPEDVKVHLPTNGILTLS